MQTTATSAERLRAVRYVWYDWRLSYGAVTLTVLLSIVLGHLAVGVVTLLLARVLRMFGRTSETTGRALPFAMTVSSALYLVGVVMVAISLLMHTKVMAKIFDPSSINEDIPYVSALIVYPMVFVFAAYARIRSGRCTRTQATGDDTGGETRYLLRYTMVLSGAMSLVGWIYYYAFYINVNFNSPDRFFYYIVPLSLYVLSLIYLGMRYNPEAYMARIAAAEAAEAAAAARRNRCRCLVVHDDRLLLSADASGMYDTPLADADNIDTLVAPLRADTDDFGLRKLYAFDEGQDQGSHYLCHIHDQRQPQSLPGQWFTLAEVQNMARAYRLKPELCAEILRLYTIAMDRQKYDRRGRRKYPLKNFHPTFRLRDIYGWDIDFQDDRRTHKRMWNVECGMWNWLRKRNAGKNTKQ